MPDEKKGAKGVGRIGSQSQHNKDVDKSTEPKCRPDALPSAVGTKPGAVLLQSTKALEVALAISNFPGERRVSAIVAGHDISKAEETAKMVEDVVKTTKNHLHGSISGDTKVLWMGDDIPDSFDGVRLALQVSSPPPDSVSSLC